MRTFSNSLETVLTLVALYYWLPGNATSKEACIYPFTRRQIALFLAALSCAIRPTSAILWIYMGLIELLETDWKGQLLLEVLSIGYSSSSSTFHDMEVCTVLNFNVFLILFLFPVLLQLGQTVL